MHKVPRENGSRRKQGRIMSQENWQARFSDSILNRKYGIIFTGARRGGRGEWSLEIPDHVAEFLGLMRAPGAAGRQYSMDFHSTQEALEAINAAPRTPTARPAKATKRGSSLFVTFQVRSSRAASPERRKVARGVPAIRNLQDLLDHFGAETPQGLNRRVYKSTEAGASISVQTPDGRWHHNGQDWRGVHKIVAFTIQTIVEGSDATVDSDPFVLPVAVADVDRWIEYMEAEADRLWHVAND